MSLKMRRKIEMNVQGSVRQMKCERRQSGEDKGLLQFLCFIL